MNEQERIDSIIQALEDLSEIITDSFDAGFNCGISNAIQIIRSYYPTKEQQDE